MSCVEERALLALRLLGAAPSEGVSHRLLLEASQWRLGSEPCVELPGAFPVEVFESLSALPARWAELAVAVIDPSTPEGARCAQLAAADPRAGVRRALATVPGLPVEVCDAVVAAAAEAEDIECLTSVLEHQDATPEAWARWLTGTTGTAFGVSPWTSRDRLTEIARDRDAMEFFLAEVESPSLAAVALLATVSGSPHLVDLLPLVRSRGAVLTHLLRDLHIVANDCDDRTVEWLANLEDPFVLNAGDLSLLDDPAAIRRWWNSRISGRAAALFDRELWPSKVLVRTVGDLVAGECRDRLAAGEDPAAASREVVSIASLMAQWAFTRHRPARDAEEASAMLEVVDVVLGLCGEFDDGIGVSALFGASSVLSIVHAAAPEELVTPHLVRLAELAPARAGAASLLFADPPVEVMDAVAADPERFGVTAESVVAAAQGAWLTHPVDGTPPDPARLWAKHQERFESVVVSLPGLVPALLAGNPDKHTVGVGRVAQIVTRFASDRFGDRAEAWDSFLALGPTFTGSVAELVEICSTFTD